MNIAITGPEKFEFQDMACIDLALTYKQFGLCALIPEPSGGEDACLKWSSPSPLTLEVQVKGSKGIATLDSLVDYLLHYPPRESEGSLLQRLKDNDDSFVLFFLTARCNDELSPLLQARPFKGLPAAIDVSVDLATRLREEIVLRSQKKPLKDDSSLSLARWKNLEILSQYKISDFKRVLDKVSILEQETAETIEVRLHEMLRAERFDTLSIRGVLARLRDLVNRSKRDQSDVLCPIIQELQKYSPQAIRPDTYRERDIEDELEAILCNERVLLLAGPPRSGKSWTAKAIAGRLQTQGFEIRTGQHVSDAERFLTDVTGAERLYFLDDPLGSRELRTDASAQLAALGTLCENIPINRCLIVAQFDQVLMQVKAVSDITKCRTGGKTWRRLAPLSVEVAISIWELVASSLSLPRLAIDRVIGLIQKETNLREPGALVYLAQTWSELDEVPLDQEILLQSRKDASDFARSLAMQSHNLHEILTASALATTPSEGVTSTELSFIINGGDDLPSISDTTGIISVWGSDESFDVSKPPTYQSTQLLDLAQNHCLEELQRRRIITGQGNQINFTHPYLRAGAQTLITPDIPSDLPRVLDQLKRAIACPSPITSLAAARNLRWIRLALQGNDVNAVFDAAYLGTRSLFPATRDCSFEFLIELSELLPTNIRKKIPSISESMVLDLSQINTSYGTGFISKHYNWRWQFSSNDEVKPYLDAIEAEAPLSLDLSLSRRILQALENNPINLTDRAMQRFLHTDEAIVRAAAAKLWIKLPRSNDENILSRISNDSSPAMSAALLDALVYGWDSLGVSRRDKILGIIEKHAKYISCATVLFSRLVLFNRQESFGKNPPWEIFTTLMPIVIDNIPVNVSFHNGRLNCVIDDAFRVISKPEIFPVIESWAKRLMRRIGNYVLSEFELSIIEPLIKSASGHSRLVILRKLLRLYDTGARVVFLKDIITNWAELSIEEREIVKDTIRDATGDKQWLLATVLTRREPPIELIQAFGYPSNLLELSTTEIESNLNSNIFSACVHMFVGWPQPLWWYAAHHSQNPTWEKVIINLANNSIHPLHSVSFYEVANFESEDLFAQIINGLPDSALLGAFEKLLDFKISRTGDWRTTAWLALFERGCHLQVLHKYIERIDEVLEGILEELIDIEEWLGNSTYAGMIYNLLPCDIKIARSLRDIETHLNEFDSSFRDFSSVLDVIKEFLNSIIKNPPRLYCSWVRIKKFAIRVGADQEVVSIIEDKRMKSFELHQAIRDGFNGSPQQIELKGWINTASGSSN